MPQRQNPRDNGLRRSLRIQEKRKSDERKQKKAHVTFGTAATMKVVLGVFLLFAITSNLIMPQH